MSRNLRVIILTILVTLAGVAGVLEWRRSVIRADALSELNYAWSGLKTDTAKTAAVVKANTIIEQNQSLFDFSNSGASEGNGMHIKQDLKTGQWIIAQ